MINSTDPIVFFADRAARHLRRTETNDPVERVQDMFNTAYPYGMPMAEYARKSLAQARRAPKPEDKLAELARFTIVEDVISGRVGDATDWERSILAAKAALRKKQKSLEITPTSRKPGEGTVILATATDRPYTIANVQWDTDWVEQRWMHQDSLSALIARLVATPPEGLFIVAVTSKAAFLPDRLAFSGRQRLAICYPDRTDRIDTARLTRLLALFKGKAVPWGHLKHFRNLCRERARTLDTPPIDKQLIQRASQWDLDPQILHDLLLPATDTELRVITLTDEVSHDASITD